jgi:hypothetical protein
MTEVLRGYWNTYLKVSMFLMVFSEIHNFSFGRRM